MDIITVTDAMQPVPSPVQMSDTISEIIDRLSAERLDTTALDLVHTTATLSGDQSLQSALGTLIDHDRTGLRVMSADGTGLIGWVTHRDVLSAYNTRIRQSAQQTATQPRSVLPVPAPLKLPDDTIDARLQ
jgi:CIC family chloride channel protein